MKTLLGLLQLKAILRALKYRNFRLFFLGQSISLIGTWMQRIALAWLVYRLSDSALLLGVVGFASQIPTFFIAPIAGVFADRLNRHRILILAQTAAMMQALLLAFLVLTDTIQIWHIILLSIFLGVINGFDMPTRQSFMVEMIDDRRDLSNAIALNSSMVNGARLLGPSLAGVLIAASGEGICFLINGLSYGAVILSLVMMKVGRRKNHSTSSNIRQELKEGLNYVAGFEPIWAILLLFAIISLMGMPYVVLMPVFARDILHGGPLSLGLLMGSSGVGALTGALYLASRKTVLGLDKLIPAFAIIFGLGLAGFAFSKFFILSMLLMYFLGIGMMIQMAGSNTLLQTIVEDDKRGRVMSFYTMAFMGMQPVGSLIAGSLASHIGAPWTVFTGAVACIIAAIIFVRRLPVLRLKTQPVYLTKGIIPEIASGIQNATESGFTSK